MNNNQSASGSLAPWFANESDQLPAIMLQLEALWMRLQLPEEEKMRFELALEELFMNTVMHAGQPSRARLELMLEPGRVRMVYIDDGPEFDPFTAAPAPDLSQDVEAREVGGLGVHLITQMFDAVAYERAAGNNRVVLVAAIAH